jgi:hypothetical protein
VELKFVNNVKEKNETTQSWRAVMNTGASEETLANARRVQIPTPRLEKN